MARVTDVVESLFMWRGGDPRGTLAEGSLGRKDIAMFGRIALGALMFAVAAPALAAEVPADCSAVDIPDQPLEVMIHAKPVALTHVALRLNSQGMSINDQNFTGHRLQFADDPGLFDRKYEIDFTLATNEGETPEGRTFLIYPTKSMKDQPQLGDSGFPVMQGWGVEGPEIGSNIGSAFNIASMKLVFGDVSDGKLPGMIYFCLAADSEDRFTKAKVNTTYAVGRFEAVVE